MCNSIVVDSMLDFLIYSYFAITFEDEDTEIIDAAAKRAYNDATMRGALVFKKSFDKNYDNSEYISEYNKHEKMREAIRYAVKIFAVKKVVEAFEYIKTRDFNESGFNEWHENLCEHLVNSVDKKHDTLLDKYCNKLYNMEINHQRYFTYGNAQKLVNMFLKNLYVLTVISSQYKNDEKAKNWYDRYKWIIDKSDCFHIPLDSYIGIDSWSTSDKIGNYQSYIKQSEQVTEKRPALSFSNENEYWIKKAKVATQNDTKTKLNRFSGLLKDNKEIQQELKKILNKENLK